MIQYSTLRQKILYKPQIYMRYFSKTPSFNKCYIAEGDKGDAESQSPTSEESHKMYQETFTRLMHLLNIQSTSPEEIVAKFTGISIAHHKSFWDRF